MRTSTSSEPQFSKTPHGPRREFVIDDVSQPSATSPWFYRVNVSVFQEVQMSTFIDDDVSDASSEDGRLSGSLLAATDVEHYSILRRYSDFLQLYEQIRDLIIGMECSTNSIPPFPAKEFVSPALKSMLRRTSSSKVVLDDRSAKFQVLLQWIENHPVARNCDAFVDFIGKPPQSHHGYVSLKEYTPPDWLSSLQQTTQGVESRRRRYSMSNLTVQSRRQRSISEVSGGLASFQHFEAVKQLSSMRGAYKLEDRFSM
ncbi:SCP extracellular protein [Phytophthora nicotianae]|uniref:SCP extracellular protein n=1 Tax=Phytophthora nicotianae TaxID=4792 RepID=A0A0W8D5W5_PHYNI|nr:SCP extracellular protein [Phytophthora nicotianae]